MLKQLRLLSESSIAHKLEGLRFSLLRATLEFDQLVASLREIESRRPLSASFDESFTALSRCWSILDCAERATRLARSIPFMDRSKESRTILRDLDKITKLRNDFQHLEGNSAKFPDDAPPIMGAISWQQTDVPLKYHTMFLASGSLRSSFPGLIFDRQEQCFVSDFVFSVFGKDVSISETSARCERYLEIVEAGLEASGMTVESMVSPGLFAAELRLEPGVPLPPEDAPSEG